MMCISRIGSSPLKPVGGNRYLYIANCPDSLRFVFVDGVQLVDRFHGFPGSFEARRNDEGIACSEGLDAAVVAGERDFAVEDRAELVLGVVDAPLARSRLPDFSEEAA